MPCVQMLVHFPQNIQQQALDRTIKGALHHKARDDFQEWLLQFDDFIAGDQRNGVTDSRTLADSRSADDRKTV